MTGSQAPPPVIDRPAAGDAPSCPMCGTSRRVLDTARLEEHCAECGLVFDGAELVTAPPRPGPTETSDGSGRGIGPFTAPGSTRRALGSTLSLGRDGQGRPLGSQRRYEYQHLKRVQQRQTARAVEGPLERSQARGEIALCGERLGLPPVVLAEAERIFREAKVRGLFRGRNLPSSVGATVYAACRRYSIPRTLGEVAKALNARRSEVGRAFKVVQRGVDIPIPSVGTRAFLARYAEELALSAHVRSNVEAMLDDVNRNPELSGLSPHGLVAALIYLAAERNGEHRSRAQVARVSAVTEVTLRSTSRLVEKTMRPAPHD
ncbi:MAG: transcription initiation factor IIB family protein [Thermoplasmata archaeon]|nr:transcription initiation factor IIB family protein [Thermoplasmata archaeon]MCI4354690.1 transcription initiation factor IIB family protein [Thermoplasmata archaeon]